ncbi:uncharacterized protein STEHIDRAFT_114805 [Stereum hirsutum FP-91666 SS1]|uniref:uncharacterized protein n=1 Tax=Stereum hirsutum (strain FP-91666) TaxID=721885 RepID=UPI00044494C3|nr:uncharacterized protein STEHIDRAFT_114805 [Stereum hirsutum FP-91666 SS1]EIM82188.1 hypothetical protein STEHIDRAFT_114805 [Stereum hirsutum FP-91666 SS1]
MVFGSEWKTLDDPAKHIIMQAIREGLDYKASLWGHIARPFVADRMGAVDLVKSLWTAWRTTWEGVTRRIELNPDSDGGVDVALVHRWGVCLRRYLQALPLDETSTDDRQRLTQSELFALAMSKTQFLPKGLSKKYMVGRNPCALR